MQTLKIEVAVNINDPIQMAAASQFLAALGGVKTPTATLEVVKDDTTTAQPPITEKPKRKRRSKEEIAADKATKEAPAETPTNTSTDAETQAGNQEDASGDNDGDGEVYKIAEVRTLVSEKVGVHRAAIKAKLQELGAKNVKTVKEEDYETFVEFLKALA